MKKLLSTCVTAALFCGFNLSAHGQVKVIGGADSLHRACYEQAFSGNLGTRTALEVCNDALAQPTSRKNKTASYVNRGVLLMRSGNLEAARADYEKAIELNPNYEKAIEKNLNLRDAYINYGALLIQLKDYDGALTALNKAVEGEHRKNLHEAFYNRAIAYDRKDQHSKAYNDLKRALELRPDWADAKRAIGRYKVVSKAAG